MGFSRAGLGLEDSKNKRPVHEETFNILSDEGNTKNLSFAEIGSLIRDKL